MLKLIQRYSHINWAIADQTMVSGANFLTGILVARFLGIEQFGQYALAWVVLEIILSIQNSLIMMPMMSIAPKQSKTEMPAVYGAIVAQQTAFLALSLILFSLGVWIASRLYPPLTDITAALACLLAMSQSQNFVRRCLFTQGRPDMACLSDAVRYLGQIAILFLLLQTVATKAPHALWIQSGTAAVGAVLGASFIRRIAWDRQVMLRTLRRHWSFAKWLLCSEIMRSATADLFILVGGGMLGAAAAGGIRAAQQIVGVSHIIQFGLDNVVPVRAADHFRKGDMPALITYLKRFALLGGAAIGVIAVVAAVAPEFWLGLIYGSEYRGHGHLVQWWALIYFVGFFGRPCGAGLRTVERTGVIFRVHLMSAIFAVITVYPLIHYFDALGVMIGIFGTFLVRLIVSYRGFLKVIYEHRASEKSESSTALPAKP